MQRKLLLVGCRACVVALVGFLITPKFVRAQVAFGSVGVGGSATHVVSVTIPVGANLGSISVVTQGAVDLDFTSMNGGSCTVGAVYTANSKCTVNVRFAPKFAGTRFGAVVLSNASGVIASQYLEGAGIAPMIGFLPPTFKFPDVGHDGTPWGIAADAAGNVYVADTTIGDFKPGAVYKGFIEYGSWNQFQIGSGFGFPNGVAVDGMGNVYISDAGDRDTPSAVYKETL